MSLRLRRRARASSTNYGSTLEVYTTSPERGVLVYILFGKSMLAATRVGGIGCGNGGAGSPEPLNSQYYYITRIYVVLIVFFFHNIILQL